MEISAIDIPSAYFNASMDEDSEPTYVMLPPANPDHARGCCGLLLEHMYGTRAAADGWQHEYSGYVKIIGFVQGTASLCIFVHEAQSIACSVHGDGFTSAGEGSASSTGSRLSSSPVTRSGKVEDLDWAPETRRS